MELAVENKVERYSAYKYAGEDWMGEVPNHWDIRKLKHIFFEKKMKSNPELNAGSISFGEVVVKDDEKIPESTKSSYQEVLEGEFLINPLNLNYDLISLRIALSKINVVVSSGYIVINNHEDIDKQYYKYLLHRYDVAYMKLLGSGVRQTISFNHIANSLLLFPPKEEQTAIAQFLDRKTAQIDQAIAQKEKQIELLKERRQILIHKAVTRGLNPNVKLKPSGVEWIGEIPEHWGVRHLRRLFNFLNTKRIPLSAEEREKKQGPFPYYGASGIIDYVDDYLFEEPLILIAEDGANLLSKSTPLAFIATGKYWVNNHAHIIKPIYNGFTYWAELLSSVDYTTSISGAAQPKLTMDRLASIKLPVPPENEILEIGKYIDNVSKKIGSAIFLKEQEIEKLKEYKATLINSAVTGKIKVC